jgi:hypothetical protein
MTETYRPDFLGLSKNTAERIQRLTDTTSARPQAGFIPAPSPWVNVTISDDTTDTRTYLGIIQGWDFVDGVPVDYDLVYCRHWSRGSGPFLASFLGGRLSEDSMYFGYLGGYLTIDGVTRRLVIILGDAGHAMTGLISGTNYIQFLGAGYKVVSGLGIQGFGTGGGGDHWDTPTHESNINYTNYRLEPGLIGLAFYAGLGVSGYTYANLMARGLSMGSADGSGGSAFISSQFSNQFWVYNGSSVGMTVGSGSTTGANGTVECGTIRASVFAVSNGSGGWISGTSGGGVSGGLVTGPILGGGGTGIGGIIGAGTIDYSNIATGGIHLSNMGSNSVDSSKIVDGSILGSDIGTGTITGGLTGNIGAATLTDYNIADMAASKLTGILDGGTF